MSKVLLQRDTFRTNATIASGQTKSGAVATFGYVIFGAVLPSTLDGTALTFEVSADNSTFQALYDSAGAAVAITVAASRSYDLPTALAAWPYFKFVMGTSQSTTDTVIPVVMKG